MEDTQLDRLDLSQLSDDELSTIDPSKLSPVVEEESVEVQPQPEVEQPEATVDDADQHAEPVEQTQGTEPLNPTNPDFTAPVENEPAAEGDEPQKQEPELTSADVDYKAFYDRVTASFKANGRDIALTDPDEIVSLMQRGAGFAKKMATLKPSMRVLRTLENHGITEQDLGFLIDLHKKNPEAINKLIKESGVDVYSLDDAQAEKYKPQAQMATDQEVDLESVIQDLSASSATFNKTLDVVVNQWDPQSRGTVASNPQLLRLLDGHMQQGYFDMVMSEVERLRIIGGHIDGLSDLDAYSKVGDMLNARGAFNKQPQVQAQPVAPTPVAQPQPKPTELNAQRRAASNPRPTSQTVTPEPDLSTMSDDEVLNFLSRR